MDRAGRRLPQQRKTRNVTKSEISRNVVAVVPSRKIRSTVSAMRLAA